MQILILISNFNNDPCLFLNYSFTINDLWVRKIPWRRKWQFTPVLLPGKSHGQRSLVGYSPWGCKESDTTERLQLRLIVLLLIWTTVIWILLKNLCLNSTELTNVFESLQISECFFFSFLWKLVARNEILGCHIYIIVDCIMFFLSLFFIFIYFAAPGLSSGTWDPLVVASAIFINSCSMQILGCGTWDLVPWPGIELGPPALGEWSLSHWATGPTSGVSSWFPVSSFFPSKFWELW